MLRAGCDWMTMQLLFPLSTSSLLFFLRLRLLLFFSSLLPAISVPFPFILARPCLFCSLRRPYASFSFSLLVFPPHSCRGPSAAPRYLYVISFFPLSGSLLFSPLTPISHTSLLICFPPFLLPPFSFHQSASLLSFSFFSPRLPPSRGPPLSFSPPPLFSITLIHFSSLLLIHTSIIASIRLGDALSFCPCSVTREKPPSCCTTFCTPSPSRSF